MRPEYKLCYVLFKYNALLTSHQMKDAYKTIAVIGAQNVKISSLIFCPGICTNVKINVDDNFPEVSDLCKMST